MQEMGGMAALVGAAVAGQFAVDQASGEQMVLSIGRMRTQLNAVLTRLGGVASQDTPLGTLPEAEHVAKFNRLVASGDQQSAMYALTKFAETLEHAETAVRKGMANYGEVEAAAERSFEKREAERLECEARAREYRHGGMRAV